MLKAEGVGRTIEKAIEDALFQLKAPREDVDIKILEEGGLFKKAKVVIEISADVLEKYQAREVKKQPVQTTTEKKENQTEKTIAQIAEKKQEEPKKNNKEESPKTQTTTNEKVDESKFEASKTFISGILSHVGVENTISEQINGDVVCLEVKTNKAREVIGNRGDVLNALSILANVVDTEEDNTAEKPKRIIVDCEDYRKRRESSLIQLSHRIAQKVQKTGRSAKLEPMIASDRRIIHLTLQDMPNVQTFSKGNEPYRYVVVALKKDENTQSDLEGENKVETDNNSDED